MKLSVFIFFLAVYSVLAIDSSVLLESAHGPLSDAILLFDVDHGLTEIGGGYLAWQSIGRSSVVATSTVVSGSTTNLPAIVEYDGRKTVFFNGVTGGGYFTFQNVNMGAAHTLLHVLYRPTAAKLSLALTTTNGPSIVLYFNTDNATYLQYASGYRVASATTNTGIFVDIMSAQGAAGGNALSFRRNYVQTSCGAHTAGALSSSLNSIGAYGSATTRPTQYLVLCAAWDRGLSETELDALEEDIKRRLHR